MKRLLALLVAAMAAVLTGCGSLGAYAAKVNGERISVENLDDELDAVLANKTYLARVDEAAASQPGGEGVRGAGKGTVTTRFAAALLDRRISLEVIHQEVRRRKLVPTADHRTAARDQVIGLVGGEAVFKAFSRSYRDILIAQFAEIFALQDSLGSAEVKAADVARFYEQNKPVFDRTCVRHILVDGQDKATAIRARIGAGEDFATIAKAESLDRGQGGEGAQGGSAAQGGALGCVPSGGFVAEFETAMAALQPGQVSDPVQTQFGFHVIEVTARQMLTLEEATPEIRQRLESQAGSPVAAFVNQALQRAKIEVNPRYGTYVATGQNPGVRPPSQPRGVTPTTVAPLSPLGR